MDVVQSHTEQFFFTLRDERVTPNLRYDHAGDHDDDDDDDQLDLNQELHCWRMLAA